MKEEENQTCLSWSCSVMANDSKEANSIMYFQMFMSHQAFLKHNRSYLQQKARMNKQDDIKFWYIWCNRKKDHFDRLHRLPVEGLLTLSKTGVIRIQLPGRA